jgi:hypothetical protein
MGSQTFPPFSQQPGATFVTFKITGANVSSATAGPLGLDGRGQMTCTAIKSGNQVTLTFLQAYADAPYVEIHGDAGQLNTQVQIVSETSQQIVFNTVESDDATTVVNDANLRVLVIGYNTVSYFS